MTGVQTCALPIFKRLREKLSGGEELGWQIKTVWGVGYKFEVK